MRDVAWEESLIVALGTLGGGMIGALISARSLRRQSEVQAGLEEKRMAVETERLARAHAAEMDRLREQHAEDHRRNRQTTYHLLLDVLDEMNTEAAADALRLEPEHVEQRYAAALAWKERYDRAAHLLNGLLVFGPEDVAAAARDAINVMTRADVELQRAMQSAEIPKIEVNSREVEGAVERLVAAMRADVAP